MPAPIPDDKRTEILAAIKAGLTRNAVARQCGVSPSTVSKVAAENGHAFDRTKTKSATEAALADAQADRASLATASLVVAKRALKRMHEALPKASAKDAAIAFGIAIDKHRQLVEMDRDPEGLAAVDAWLRGITGQ